MLYSNITLFRQGMVHSTTTHSSSGAYLRICSRSGSGFSGVGIQSGHQKIHCTAPLLILPTLIIATIQRLWCTCVWLRELWEAIWVYKTIHGHWQQGSWLSALQCLAFPHVRSLSIACCRSQTAKRVLSATRTMRRMWHQVSLHPNLSTEMFRWRMFRQRQSNGSIIFMLTFRFLLNTFTINCCTFVLCLKATNQGQPWVLHTFLALPFLEEQSRSTTLPIESFEPCLAILKQKLATSSYPIISLRELFKFAIKWWWWLLCVCIFFGKIKCTNVP